ncbi:MAG: Gfo/Idh/MocA family oxidoreductase [Candidatus Bathyarchaeia archaeon]
MKKINLGIIGLGFIGKVHLRNCLKLDSAIVLAAADTSKKALNYAKAFGVKHLFTDYRKLLKLNDLDAVIVSLPTHLHAECAISAMEHGKHVFLEKPLARNPKEGREIISAARKNGVKFMVGYPLRFIPDFTDLKKKIDSGVLGDVQSAHAVNIAAGPFFHKAESNIPKPIPEWWLSKELAGGGVLIDLGSHMINLMRWYFGEINSIKAYLGHRFNMEVEDYAICVAKFKDEKTAIIDVGWFSLQTRISIELYGTVDHDSIIHRSQSKAITAIKLILGQTPKFSAPYLKEISHFINSIIFDSVLYVDDALKDLEVIDKAYRNRIEL